MSAELPKCVNCGAERRKYTDKRTGQVKLLGGRNMCAACYMYWRRHNSMRTLDGKAYTPPRPTIPNGKLCDCGQPATQVFHTRIHKFQSVVYFLCEDCYQLEIEMKAEFGD